jgi:hypothetical protein
MAIMKHMKVRKASTTLKSHGWGINNPFTNAAISGTFQQKLA